MDKFTYYLNFFGLNEDYTETELKEAYRDLLHVWHPDKHNQNERLRIKAEQKIKEINNAYIFLKNILDNNEHYACHEGFKNENNTDSSHNEEYNMNKDKEKNEDKGTYGANNTQYNKMKKKFNFSKIEIASIMILVISISFVFANFNESKNENNPEDKIEDLKQWHNYNDVIDSNDPNFPLKCIGDGFKVIEEYKTKPVKRNGNEYPSKHLVKWGWKYKLKNVSNNNLKVKVIYILEDKDGFTLDKHELYYELCPYVGPGETKTIQKTSNMNYKDALKVDDRSWKISYKIVQ